MTRSKQNRKDLDFFREQGRKGGKLSAAARMLKLTAEQRSLIAKRARAARAAKWRKLRYARLLPTSDVLERALQLVSPLEAYLFRRVWLDGCDSAQLAATVGIPKEEVLSRANQVAEIIKAVGAEGIAHFCCVI